jgi:protein gp37
MAEKTIIAWTDHTFNIAWGCVKIDPGCAHCYADAFDHRIGGNHWGANAPRRTFSRKHWEEPLQWERESRSSLCGKAPAGIRGPGLPHLIFSSSMCDIFEDHPTIATERDKLWNLIRQTPHLHWQLLTKRADRIAGNLPSDWGQGWPHVWLGVSMSEPKGMWRADALRNIPAAVRFISYEPALAALPDLNMTGIDWLIYGGESGPGFRPHDLAWPRQMKAKCEAAGIPFFFKQSAAPRTEMGTTLDGETIHNFPTPRTLPAPPCYRFEMV